MRTESTCSALSKVQTSSTSFTLHESEVIQSRSEKFKKFGRGRPKKTGSLTTVNTPNIFRVGNRIVDLRQHSFVHGFRHYIAEMEPASSKTSKPSEERLQKVSATATFPVQLNTLVNLQDLTKASLLQSRS